MILFHNPYFFIFPSIFYLLVNNVGNTILRRNFETYLTENKVGKYLRFALAMIKLRTLLHPTLMRF